MKGCVYDSSIPKLVSRPYTCPPKSAQMYPTLAAMIKARNTPSTNSSIFRLWIRTFIYSIIKKPKMAQNIEKL